MVQQKWARKGISQTGQSVEQFESWPKSFHLCIQPFKSFLFKDLHYYCNNFVLILVIDPLIIYICIRKNTQLLLVNPARPDLFDMLKMPVLHFL